ncbi:16S rRNA (cytidine(1402)-2'-O)-methyltransferase [Malacoplasma iowae]|uniref:16S rRNA (Cytidine(1402)-2'-O)-methyltransferase n=1 Tax=Malacoplasma iowae 695 TaxID=1048830 RepID=A0A6P1LF18_MALIO|nr:16S rRNA (cytidine(1402)-2'-O)-methyltransferase [Malacoplasma iowae]VEU61948.1 S-adenosylmethionine-dependent methyltransferase, YraL family [Mycoplasmopsis fermentans]EGZ31113.1 methyltransferase [Malacoplasma iowae 695]QHG90048.1 16S rRNA (cytidine(1402)-2'-O)-methyltransferase [Malacoplasma iowae 695]WPL36221.1 16S rRNA (cytidine(1402)-2'-O)-methyltransferase [Malacoplasma iowae]WPL38493.1 16S rRNA (cytidine(1402)-2'-O)-methyltransferase [Malacoplasma iowae]
MKKIYVIATPIGDLKEVSEKAISAFNEVEIMFCEDTRNTKKLLSLLNIDFKNKTFISSNGFNEKSRVESFVFEDKIYGIVSDAGYPLISDPGYLIVQKAYQEKIKIEIVNGPCSINHALMLCGYPINNFYFNGFLSKNKNEALKKLNELKTINTVLVIFESVHNLLNTLKLISDVFGKDKQICVCRELSKMNETIYKDTYDNLIEQITLKGEFVIVINNTSQKTKDKENEIDYLSFHNEVKLLVKQGHKEKDACKLVAYKFDISSNKLFNSLQQKKNIV